MWSRRAILVVILFASARAEANSSHAALEAFYLRPLGPLAADYPNAAGGYGSVALFFPDHYALVLKAGYVSYSSRGEQELQAVHLLAGPRYYFLTSGWMPYAGINLGINLVVESTAARPDHLTAQLAWQLGLGLLIPVVDRLGLDFSVKYNAHFYEHARMMTGFECGLAATFALF